MTYLMILIKIINKQIIKIMEDKIIFHWEIKLIKDYLVLR